MGEQQKMGKEILAKGLFPRTMIMTMTVSLISKEKGGNLAQLDTARGRDGK